MALRGGKRDVLDVDISYDMERLFDHYNFDHVPKEKRLDLFKQRDLPHVKHYKAAVKIFGGPPKRTRVIIAPPMETPLKHRLGVYHNVMVAPAPPIMNGPLKPQPEPVKALTKEERGQQEEADKLANYKSWIAKRKQLCGDLNNLGLNEGFLARKPDKSELEKRVQAKYRADRLWKPESPPPPEVVPSPPPPPDVPAMTVPPPDGLQILDKFLSLNRMRLMDLFLLADKDKSWTISREEFMGVVTKAEIPLSESEVEDMITTLDSDLDDELSYQELNKGLLLWRRQRRSIKQQGDEISALVTSAAIQGNAGTIPVSKEQSKDDKDSRPGTKEQSRGSKPPSREQSRERVTAEKSSKSTPNPTPRGRASQDSYKKSLSRQTISREMTGSMKEQDQVTEVVEFREKSDLETPRKYSRETKSKGEDQSSQEFTNADTSLPASQQGRDRTSEMVSSHVLFSRENMSTDKNSETIPLDSQMDKSLYEDMLFTSEDTPRATFTAQDIGEEEENQGDLSDGQEMKRTSSAGGTRPGSHKVSSGSQSRASTPNSLEPPEPDLRQESRMPESAEAMVDMRKHDRVVLSRNNVRRSLSREKRITFDDLPGVIKVGYKPIDDHCSESTLGGEMANMVNQFRREKLKEYFEVRKLFEETGLPFTQKTLDRVLLYPGDRPTNSVKKIVNLPLGPLMDEHCPFSQPKPKKRSKKGRRGLRRISRMSNVSGAGGNGGDVVGASKSGGVGDSAAAAAGGGTVGNSGRAVGGAAGGGLARPRGRSYQEDERSGSGSSKRSYITVEDVYPFASSVAPKVYKENLSSGRALITRKVDNWMSFEEYSRYTQNLPNRFRHFNRKSDPDAAWPGYLLDKLRLCMDEDLTLTDGRGRPIENRDSFAYEGLGTGLYNGRGNAVFRHTGQSKRAYPGYNNDLLTWPVGENGILYGNIDEHRVLR